jgi:hypothetical protein
MLDSYKGIYAEHIFMTACLSRGMHIYRPVADVNGIDLLIQNRDKFLRIQVKSTSVEKSNRPGTYQINCRKGFDCTAYTDEFDLMAAVILPLDLYYIIPIAMLNKTTIGINPGNPNCKYNDYKNRFDLLTAKQ